MYSSELVPTLPQNFKIIMQHFQNGCHVSAGFSEASETSSTKIVNMPPDVVKHSNILEMNIYELDLSDLKEHVLQM